jgi:molybdate transport system ATP-binding protein
MSIYVKIKKSLGEFQLNIEFEAQNEVLALLGASGCGKSMTLKCIAGIVCPDEGVIIVNGNTLFDSKKHINLSPQKRHVGLLFQNYALFPNMTVRQNIYSVLQHRRGQTDPESRLKKLMESFYIKGLEDHYPVQLSGGQQQRVALARILASEPSIIMLDEPLSALDSYLRWQVEQELIQMLENFDGTTLYVSHNRDEVFRICEKVCVIDKGSSEKVCSVNKLFNAPPTIASALLSGCKNYSRVERRGCNTVYAIDWDVNLRCREDVADDIRYIGVRTHFIVPCAEKGENTISCRVVGVMQDVFSTTVMVMPENADPRRNFSHIRMELPKQAFSISAGDLLSIRIDANDIMLLRK